MSKKLSAIFTLLNPDNSLSINRPLAHAIGLNETIIYSTLLSKYRYYEIREMLVDEEWFYCTAYDLQESTTLSEKVQKKAIDNLCKLGLIKVEKRGVPAKRFFRICDDEGLLVGLIDSGSEKANKQKIDEKEKLQEKSQKRAEKNADNSLEEEHVSNSENEVKKQSQSQCLSLFRQNGGTSSDQTAEQVLTKQRNKFRPNSGTSSDQMADKTKYIKLNNNKPNLTNQSINPSISPLTDTKDGMNDGVKEIVAHNISLEELKELAALSDNPESELSMLEEVYDVIHDVISMPDDKDRRIRINSDEVSVSEIKRQYRKLDKYMVSRVLNNVIDKDLHISNMSGYLIATLYNEAKTGILKNQSGQADEYFRARRGDPYKYVT